MIYYKNIIISVFLVIVVCFFILKKISYGQADILPYTQVNKHDKSVICVSGVEYIFSKNGITQCILKSSYVYMDEKNEKIFLCNPKIELFLDNNETLYLSARSGLLDKSSGCVDIFGDVSIQGWGITLKANNAEYNSNSLSLTSNKSTVFFEENLSVKSDTLIIYLGSKIFKFNGNVRSKISNAY